jgi:hypothetical protein
MDCDELGSVQELRIETLSYYTSLQIAEPPSLKVMILSDFCVDCQEERSNFWKFWRRGDNL